MESSGHSDLRAQFTSFAERAEDIAGQLRNIEHNLGVTAVGGDPRALPTAEIASELRHLYNDILASRRLPARPEDIQLSLGRMNIPSKELYAGFIDLTMFQPQCFDSERVVDIAIVSDGKLEIRGRLMTFEGDELYVFNRIASSRRMPTTTSFLLNGLRTLEGESTATRRQRLQNTILSVKSRLDHAFRGRGPIDRQHRGNRGYEYFFSEQVRFTDRRPKPTTETSLEVEPAVSPAVPSVDRPPIIIAPVSPEASKPIMRWCDADDLVSLTGLSRFVIDDFIARNQAKLGTNFCSPQNMPKKEPAKNIHEVTLHYSPAFSQWAVVSLLNAREKLEKRRTA